MHMPYSGNPFLVCLCFSSTTPSFTRCLSVYTIAVHVTRRLRFVERGRIGNRLLSFGKFTRRVIFANGSSLGLGVLGAAARALLISFSIRLHCAWFAVHLKHNHLVTLDRVTALRAITLPLVLALSTQTNVTTSRHPDRSFERVQGCFARNAVDDSAA